MAFDLNILRTSLGELGRDDLIEIIVEQARRLHKQQQALEEAERTAKRPAAPFRREADKRTKQPKRPGRKGGHQGHFRAKPDHIDQQIEVELDQCPHCAAPVEELQARRQYIEDLPVVRAQVTELVTYHGRCRSCGPVQSSHPMKQSEATGAAAVSLGPNVQALAAELIFDLGLTRRKASRLLKQRFGLKVTPGGLQHVAHRLAARLSPRYDALKRALRQASVVHADETSWYVGTAGGEPQAWLWVFCHEEATIYRVERSRARQVITETLGSGFSGVLVSDCLNIYDGATSRQHKCYAHHLKAIKAARVAAESAGLPVAWLDRVRALLVAAMALKAVRLDLSKWAYRRYCAQLERRAEVVLGEAGVSPFDQSVCARLAKQRDHLFEFLYHDGVAATNNLAERQLRPAVITRKLMSGNRSEQGARTWSVLSSLAATARQRDGSLADWIVKELRGEPIPVLGR